MIKLFHHRQETLLFSDEDQVLEFLQREMGEEFENYFRNLLNGLRADVTCADLQAEDDVEEVMRDVERVSDAVLELRKYLEGEEELKFDTLMEFVTAIESKLGDI